MTSFSVINVVAYRPLRGIEKKYVSEFMNQCTQIQPKGGFLVNSTQNVTEKFNQQSVWYEERGGGLLCVVWVFLLDDENP